MKISGLPVSKQPKENVFLIDWLTVVFHGCHLDEVQRILGLESIKIPWVTKTSFINGYPVDTFFDHIHLRWGADDPRFYKSDNFKSAEQKARNDMGICLDMSGQGCRTFEEFSYKSWFEFLEDMYRFGGRINVTRLDLAYDDHFGLLNIWKIRRDVEDRNYRSKSKKSRVIWSDDQDQDIKGLTVEVGSKSSPVMIRIYNKAVERGFKDRHWIRVEIQLRQERSHEACKRLFQRESIGAVASGLLRNYCVFLEPGNDSNKARWKVAEYWERLLIGMEKLRLWIAPGEPYNFHNTMNHLVDQYGQSLLAAERIYGYAGIMCDRARHRFPGKLSPKYEASIAEELLRKEQRKAAHDALFKDLGFSKDPGFNNDWVRQCDIADQILDLT